MRIIAWNANKNNHPRSLEDTATLLDHLYGDLLVLSEVSQPSDENPLGAYYIDHKNCGLAVVARNGLQLALHPNNEVAPLLSAGFKIKGRVEFNLLAAWPVIPPYPQVLIEALDLFNELIRDGKSFLAGDLNSNTKVVSQKNSHLKFVNLAESLGLVRAYHAQTGEDHGQETVNTYRHAKNGEQFPLDYCFLPQQLARMLSLRVHNTNEWKALSDHYPVVLDIPDAALS